ncbi:MAG: hypothetical protein K2X77_07045 [Candidatus Obscuribacterales bacterium]|nr:hypothetical protein [Candidatus Obscuribacterales bacterium]
MVTHLAPDYLPDKMAQYETAVETMAAYVGHLRREIWREQEELSPDQEKIIALEEQCQVVMKERHDVTPEKAELVRKSLYIYAPILKAHWSRFDSWATRS